MNEIDSVINPKSIAVVGAANRPGSVGLAAFKNLLQAGYKGVLYPVHPKAKSIQGVKAYPSLLDIPDEVDMALVIVAGEKVLSVMEQAAQKQVKGCIVISTRTLSSCIWKILRTAALLLKLPGKLPWKPANRFLR